MKDLTLDTVTHSRAFPSFLVTLVAVIVLTLAMLSIPAYAGKHPYPELTHELSKGVRDILIKHGMEVRHDRGNPWFSLSAGTDAWIGGEPLYVVYFDQADEIPRTAQLEVIDYLMKLHESRGRQETIRLEMRKEIRRHSLKQPKPYFDLTLHKMR